mmetsp:Transcript_54302/g.115880  ORF Transcript_54302/g.115880 Transcript_54302/m.115880 type:complete len:234 (+) Transcript_54302:692-1393(+)
MTASKAPRLGDRVEPRSPNRGMVSHQLILFVLGLDIGSLEALDDAAVPRVLHIVVRLSIDELVGNFQVLLAAVLLHELFLLFLLEVLGPVLVDVEHLRCLCGMGHIVDFLSVLVGIPSEDRQFHQFLGVSGGSEEVVTSERSLVLIFEVLEGVVAHRTRLGIVVGGVHIQVQEVLGSVFSNSQVSRRGPQLVIFRADGARGLVEVFHLLSKIFIVGGVAVAIGVAVRVAVIDI